MPKTPKHLVFDKRPTIGTLEVPGESWDAYIVRKMTEEREYNARRAGMHNCSNSGKRKNKGKNINKS